MQVEARRSASNRDMAAAFPRYRQAVLGIRNYWYAAALSREVRDRPYKVRLLGEDIVLQRSGGTLHGLRDRCAHRGIPLSLGSSEYPGTISCRYHGFTYELSSGELVGVLSDRPDSRICGKPNVRVKTYPVEERAGIVWVYVGDEPPPPVEADIPPELLADDALVIARRRSQLGGNWRLAAEAGIDEGHARFLHRTSLWATFRAFPAWTQVRAQRSDDGWLSRVVEHIQWDDDHPRLGKWPKKAAWYRRRGFGAARLVGIRLPGIVRVNFAGWTSYEIYVPVDEDQRLEFLVALKSTRSRSSRLLFRMRYALLIHWFFYGGFHAQDNEMVQMMSIPPEALYGPDRSITVWRKMVQDDVRGVPVPMPSAGGGTSSPETT
jgi:phenylpropionate dioxygenase-like ring-hydroxylating dioxygenase large terminal subunit